MNRDDVELNELLDKAIGKMATMTTKDHPEYYDDQNSPEDEVSSGKLVQWSSGDGKSFFPAGETQSKLPPGVYEINHCDRGIYFIKIPTKTEGLIRFPQTNSDKVLMEIQNFWSKEARFLEYNLSYKRGIILWGPPGSGKSSTIQLIIEDVVKRGGIVIKFTHPNLFIAAMRSLREIQKDTPVVVLMEDIDAILEGFSESSVLNILDGVDKIEKIVFLATTNYPDKLGARVLNRPSRFDKRFKIGHPSAESRMLYFNHLIGGEEKAKTMNVDLVRWVEDTEDFSIAHLKELFVAVCILGDDYAEAIEILSSMKEQIIVDDEFEKPNNIGFTPRKKKARIWTW
jgi:hypothetical protein